MGERRLPATEGQWYLRSGNRAHVLTREERARGGYVKAAKRRGRAQLIDAADRIIWLLERVGEEDAARAVQELILPWTVPRENPRRKSPLAKAQERIAELEAFVDELLDDAKMSMLLEKLAPKLEGADPELALDAAEEILDLTLGPVRP